MTDKAVIRRRVSWMIGAVGVLLLAGAVLATDWEPLTLNGRERSTLPGRFVRLTDGHTSYDVIGPATGPVILLIPGISVPRMVFDRMIAPLAGAGFRVITFDLYGRGFSDRPRATYDATLFNRQIDDLLAALGVDGPVNLIGLASGGLQAALYAAHQPTRVESLVLIAPDGVDPEVSGFVRLLRIPLIGEPAGRLIMNAVGQRRWEERLGRYSADHRLTAEVVSQFRRQLEYKGFKRALVSSIGNLPLHEGADAFRRVERQGTRTLVIWGDRDEIIPVHLSHEVRRLMPSATYVEIPAGHLPQYERPDLTNPAILRFLDRR